MNGFLTLLYKELLRFWKVGLQTVFAPMLSTLLYLLIFSTRWKNGCRHIPV